MNRKYHLPELLAPAGDISALEAAISAGADAVYVGGKRFGARAYAKNFDNDELKEAVILCHSHGVRLYVTLNTLIYDKEMDDAVEYARELCNMGVDAIIIADLGALKRIRDAGIDIPLHGSTQMGIHNLAGADLAYSLGCERVVLARECTGKDIATITEKCKCETEIFIHGAMCVCHSGQCLFSSLVGGRSGNRGECAQPCRLPYENDKYLLSLRDMCLASHIEEIINSGVSSLKIEGRMKSPDYVYGVTSVYRRLLDERRSATKEEINYLGMLFSRGKFADEYFTDNKFSKMTGVRKEEDKINSKNIQIENEKTRSLIKPNRLSLAAKSEMHLDEPSYLSLKASLTVMGEEYTITAEAWGDAPNVAINAPLKESSVAERLTKMGNTPFSLSADDISINIDENVNMSPAAINGLRRGACDSLIGKLSLPLSKIIGDRSETTSVISFKKRENLQKRSEITALFFNVDKLKAVLLAEKDILQKICKIFVPLDDYLSVGDEIRKYVKGVYLPPVISESQWDKVSEMASSAAKLGAEYALIGNLSHIILSENAGFKPIADFRMNVSNSDSGAVLTSLGVDNLILSPELTLPMARDIGGAVISMGRIPLMLTERCFIKENFGCDKCGKASLRDRMGLSFPILREYGHRNIIFNATPTYMGDKRRDITSLGLGEHFIFSSEESDKIISCLRAYFGEETISAPHRRIGKRKNDKK